MWSNCGVIGKQMAGNLLKIPRSDLQDGTILNHKIVCVPIHVLYLCIDSSVEVLGCRVVYAAVIKFLTPLIVQYYYNRGFMRG